MSHNMIPFVSKRIMPRPKKCSHTYDFYEMVYPFCIKTQRGSLTRFQWYIPIAVWY